MDIDFVIPWVDGSDPEWITQRKNHCSPSDGIDECRFRDWNTLKYWFRAVEAYAPWVNRVFFITSGQIPSWLNPAHPKLRFVRHQDYIPQEYLPTFSSHTIELNLHRIPELSEHFVYFNDDMFLNAAVTEKDFFRNGLPCDTAVLGSFSPHDAINSYTHAVCNVMAFINKHFEKREVLSQHPTLWFSLRYGKYFLKNLYYFPVKFFSDFQNAHIPSSMLKSTFHAVWDLEPELLHNTCMNKLRGLNDVNQYIMSYYNICCGKFFPRKTDFGKCYPVEIVQDTLYDDILHGRHKAICINDHPNVKDFNREQKRISDVFQRKLPDKSTFER